MCYNQNKAASESHDFQVTTASIKKPKINKKIFRKKISNMILKIFWEPY